MRGPSILTALFALATAAFGAHPSTSGLTCASCHRDEAALQPKTSMARALQLAGDDPVLKSNPKLTVKQGAYSYAVVRRGDESIYTVSDGSGTLSVTIRWVFGVDAQTFVLEREGHYYESLVSYYPAIHGLDTTIGDQAIHPTTLLEAFGRELPPQDTHDCFQCHATGAVSGANLQLSSLTPGVQCEHCHSGASTHMRDISHGNLASMPKKLGNLSTEDLSTFCGQCHRSWETVVRNRLFGTINVRFQPYRLENSKCYDGTDHRISCAACHDPHREVVRDDSAYDPKCLACHSSAAKPVSTSLSPKKCPVANSNCITCHMPKVELPGGHKIMRDHDIRIVRANEPYPN